MDFKPHMQRIVQQLGQDMGYTPAGHTARTVRCVYSAVPVEYAGVEGFLPKVTCTSADVPEMAHGDEFLIDTEVFKVIKMEPDRVSGQVNAFLELQA